MSRALVTLFAPVLPELSGLCRRTRVLSTSRQTTTKREEIRQLRTRVKFLPSTRTKNMRTRHKWNNLVSYISVLLYGHGRTSGTSIPDHGMTILHNANGKGEVADEWECQEPKKKKGIQL